MNRAQLAAAIRSLLRSGLTVRDVAELFRAHPKAIRAMVAANLPEKGGAA